MISKIVVIIRKNNFQCWKEEKFDNRKIGIQSPAKTKSQGLPKFTKAVLKKWEAL